MKFLSDFCFFYFPLIIFIEMLDKIATNLNKYDKKLNISSSDLIKFDITHMTNYNRIDKKSKNILNKKTSLLKIMRCFFV